MCTYTRKQLTAIVPLLMFQIDKINDSYSNIFERLHVLDLGPSTELDMMTVNHKSPQVLKTEE